MPALSALRDTAVTPHTGPSCATCAAWQRPPSLIDTGRCGHPAAATYGRLTLSVYVCPLHPSYPEHLS